MKKLTLVLRALIGYSGSSEDPSKMSARFMGVILGAVSQFIPLITLVATKFMTIPAGMSVEQYVDGLTAIAQPLTLLVACIIWVVGAIRAVVNTPTVAGFLKKW